MTRKWWLVVLAGWCGCAGTNQLHRSDAHARATPHAQHHARGAAVKESSKSDDGPRFDSVLPVVID